MILDQLSTTCRHAGVGEGLSWFALVAVLEFVLWLIVRVWEDYVSKPSEEYLKRQAAEIKATWDHVRWQQMKEREKAERIRRDLERGYSDSRPRRQPEVRFDPPDKPMRWERDEEEDG